jgi:hypothetical protein
MVADSNNATVEETPKTDKEKMEALSEDDPRRQKIMTMTWRIQYCRERLKYLEAKYLAACYKDKEYRNAMDSIEDLNKQIRALLLL